MKRIVVGLTLMLTLFVWQSPTVSAGPSKQYDLLNAVKKNDLATVLSLLKEGVSPNTRTYSDGIPALILAAQEGNLEIMEALLKAGARPDIQTRDRDETALMIRAVSNDSQTLKLLLTYKADPDKVDKSNETALYKAVRARKFSNVRTLLEAGADVTITDLRGRTVLDIAQQTRSRRIIQLIEEAAAGR